MTFLIAATDPADHRPHFVDQHVGQRVRLQRRAQNMSQSALADKVGVTFQQVQKYERGANRISASKLYDIAQALEAPVGYFFDGLPVGADKAPSLQTSVVNTLIADADGMAVAEGFVRIGSPRVRRAISTLIKAMAQTGEDLDSPAAPDATL